MIEWGRRLSLGSERYFYILCKIANIYNNAKKPHHNRRVSNAVDQYEDLCWWPSAQMWGFIVIGRMMLPPFALIYQYYYYIKILNNIVFSVTGYTSTVMLWWKTDSVKFSATDKKPAPWLLVQASKKDKIGKSQR